MEENINHETVKMFVGNMSDDAINELAIQLLLYPELRQEALELATKFRRILQFPAV